MNKTNKQNTMNTIVVIAKNTIKETVRDRILLSALFVIVGIILFTLFIGSISLDQSTRIIIDFSITAIYLLQIFVAIFIGSMLMYKEIERKTFYLILTKPINRGAILIGKCIGLTITTLLVSLISTLVLIIILYMRNDISHILPIIASVLLSTFESLILILLSIVFSSITSPIMASIATVSMYFIGHAGPLFQRIFMTTDYPIVAYILRAVYYTMPNLEKFNIRNDIVYTTDVSLPLLATSVLYALAYSAFILFIAHSIFKKKDF
jgi:ABC-type transport system involved in multi-copper enzyme maturation permease subunit